MEKRDRYIKVNLPESEEAFKGGHGEGCFVLVDEDTYALWEDDDICGVVCEGTLDNEPFGDFGVHLGDEVTFELRGANRPVAISKTNI